jgi:hypothetical protein
MLMQCLEFEGGQHHSSAPPASAAAAMAAVPASALAHLERVMAKARAQPARLLLLSLVLVARSRDASSHGFQASADEAARVAALERTAATCTELAGAHA